WGSGWMVGGSGGGGGGAEGRAGMQRTAGNGPSPPGRARSSLSVSSATRAKTTSLSNRTGGGASGAAWLFQTYSPRPTKAATATAVAPSRRRDIGGPPFAVFLGKRSPPGPRPPGPTPTPAAPLPHPP